jgi:hypothetical protein
VIAKHSHLTNVLLVAEHDGQRCAGPALIAGIAVGVGVIQITTGTFKQSSLMGLQMLSGLVLELLGPLLVSVLGMTLLLPRWIDRVARIGRRAWRLSVPGAALLGIWMMLMFFSASLLAGILTTPPNETVAQVLALLAKIRFTGLLGSLLRSAGFLAALCAWCQWRAESSLNEGHRKTYIISNLLIESLMIGIGLKVIWFLVAKIFPVQELVT